MGWQSAVGLQGVSSGCGGVCLCWFRGAAVLLLVLVCGACWGFRNRNALKRHWNKTLVQRGAAWKLWEQLHKKQLQDAHHEVLVQLVVLQHVKQSHRPLSSVGRADKHLDGGREIAQQQFIRALGKCVSLGNSGRLTPITAGACACACAVACAAAVAVTAVAVLVVTI